MFPCYLCLHYHHQHYSLTHSLTLPAPNRPHHRCRRCEQSWPVCASLSLSLSSKLPRTQTDRQTDWLTLVVQHQQQQQQYSLIAQEGEDVITSSFWLLAFIPVLGSILQQQQQQIWCNKRMANCPAGRSLPLPPPLSSTVTTILSSSYHRYHRNLYHLPSQPTPVLISSSTSVQCLPDT